MIRRLTLAALAMVLVASSAFAGANATIVLRSGNRVTGDLRDHGGIGFTIYVDGQRRVVQDREVARIEFGGNAPVPEEVRGQFKADQHVTILTNGNALVGRLYDMTGTGPLQISFDTPSGRRRLSSDEIRTIHFVPPDSVGTGSSTGTTGTTPAIPTGEGIVVPGNQRWVDTGIVVREGQRISWTARGEVQINPEQGNVANPSGSVRGIKGHGPLPDQPTGALIGRIGPTPAFPMGASQQDVPMPASGRLFLGVNDDIVEDNSGAFRVQLDVPQRRDRD
jgi:hypothetical protein